MSPFQWIARNWLPRSLLLGMLKRSQISIHKLDSEQFRREYRAWARMLAPEREGRRETLEMQFSAIKARLRSADMMAAFLRDPRIADRPFRITGFQPEGTTLVIRREIAYRLLRRSAVRLTLVAIELQPPTP